MASISESIIQGLMRPAFDVQPLVEPLGMLLGGAQAQKAREERQKGLLSQAMGATDMNAFQRLIEQARNPEEVSNLIQAAQVGGTLRSQQQASNREQALRERVAKEGANLGPAGRRLAEVANDLDFDTLQTRYLDIMQNFGSNEGLLSMYGIPQSEWYKYQNMPIKELRAALSDSQKMGKATPKNYQDQQGNIITLATNEFGQVRVGTDQWVPIEEAGLTLAPNRVQTTNMNQSINDQIGTQVAANLDESLKGAQAASGAYTGSLEGEALIQGLPDSAFGPSAEIKLLGNEALIALGFDNPERIKTASDLRTFSNNRARAAVKILASGDLGSAQSLTDADREFAKQLAGGDITWNKEALKKLLYLERKIAFARIEAHNNDLNTRIGKVAPNVVPLYTVKPPVPTFYDQPGNYVEAGTGDPDSLRPGQRVYKDIFGVSRYADGIIEPNDKPSNR